MLEIILFLIKLTALILGLYITSITFRLFLMTSDNKMFNLSLGFFLISIGSFIEEILLLISQNYSISIVNIHLIESAFLLSGLGFIHYSLLRRSKQ